MKRFALVLLSVLVLVGCHARSTNIGRCDDLLHEQAAHIENNGGWLRCDPSYDGDEPASATHVVEWRDGHGAPLSPKAWLWERRLTNRYLEFYADVLACEVQAWRDGRIPSFYTDVQRWGTPGPVAQGCANAANWRLS